MTNRKPIPAQVETSVLVASARRCALCFGFEGDLTRKKGQIAHIDQDSSNADKTNLVYLCFEHHDEYDSTTSQSKGITQAELREYNRRLLAAIATDEHTRYRDQLTAADFRNDAIYIHDERLFRESDLIVAERLLRDFLDQLQTDDSYFLSITRKIDKFRSFFAEAGNQFINEELSKQLRTLLEKIDALLLFLAQHFFVFPESQPYPDDLRLCLYPNLNADREGPSTSETMAKYVAFQEQLDHLAKAVRAAYRDYRSVVKLYLYL